MTPLEGAQAWVDAWKEGWARHDADVIAARYAARCLIAEHRDTWTELEGDHGIDLAKEDA